MALRLLHPGMIALMLPLTASGTADEDLARSVRGILSDKCFHCHGPDGNKREADLRLDTSEGLLGDRETTGVVVAGDPGASELIRRVDAVDPDEQMPPPSSKLRLSTVEKQIMRDWVRAGAPWKGHWSWEAVRSPSVPATSSSWPRGPVDAFILDRLRQENLTPSAPAARARLLRRVTLDLTGLPPTITELDNFLADESPNAFEKVVDRLLASPRYGERMAWDWLDAARYADTNGFQGDPERTMWPWRDWAVRAINANMPFDQFTVEQLAGDLLPSPSLAQRVATGFNRNHMYNGEGGRIAEETRVENVFDRVETTATVWMGLTLTCARCHDHKYDQIRQREYYGLYAFFNNTSETGGGRSGQVPPVVKVASENEQRELAALTEQIQRAATAVADAEKATTFPTSDQPKPISDQLARGATDRDTKGLDRLIAHFKNDADYVRLLKELRSTQLNHSRLDKRLPRVMVMDERAEPRETRILLRGTYNRPGDVVTASVPAALPNLPTDEAVNRLTLARWLTSPRHPLTARVTVNRYWQTFFGIGLVSTPEDFGVQGERPTHPQLLDWMAAEFIRADWNVKRMHRLLVTSATYRQTAKRDPTGSGAALRDPRNRLLWRGPRTRLTAAMIRDQALAVSGLLVDTLGGPSVKPYQPAGVWSEATFGKKQYRQDHGPALYRRSLYTFWRRIVGPTMFFDAARRQTCEVRTAQTNTPLHALQTLNDITYVEAARHMAAHLLLDNTIPTGTDPANAVDTARVQRAFRLATSRVPTQPEQTLLLERLDELRDQFADGPEEAERLLNNGESPRHEAIETTEHAAWAALCLLLMNLDETLNR